MNQPPFLVKGDRIAIISTARKISRKEINPAIQLFEKWGLEVVLSEFLFTEDRQFAGTEEQRTKGLQQFLDDTNIQAIVCARGGYGTVQVIDQLDFTSFKKHPKWIVGYSDVTTLHTHIHENVGVQTIHGTMPINFPKDGSENESTLSLKKALFGELDSYHFDGHPLNISGETSGEIIGGNLSILYSLSGTNSAADMKGKILFMEDLDEYIYHIDRMMMNLRKSDWLRGVKGVLVGGMSDMNDNAVPYGQTAEEIIRQRTEDLGIPVAFNFPAGHLEPNKALYFGRKCQLVVGKEGSALIY
tara:strand:+ start:3191 stop:4093 length:903 start_codon:yes stop_codon:yes gene_type:complete